MIATDLDGTLLDSAGRISARTRAVIGRLREAGWLLVLATARPVRAVRPIVAELGHQAVVVCGNGCLTYDFAAEAVVDYRPVTTERVRHALDVLRRHEPTARMGAERHLEFLLEHRFHVPAFDALDAIRMDALDTALDHTGVGKLLVQLDGDALDYRARIAARLPEGYEITASGSAFCEITVEGVTKASALRRIAHAHGFSAADVVALGDMPNDLPALAWAGTGVAVANAHPEVLAAADFVTLSNDEDGVAHHVEFLLDGGL
ncbi:MULTISPECIES: HAD family hydrolase [Streptomyces]|uniref:HAD family hydrolase n=1 Tax=Streptomyces solicathayae TaxID=3081768 RepID=A0ABZ0LPK9_9ACTN|nr:HAD family hydrolase [Streptomyces sp. HUAS YS2]WOX21447.1 HAD family hydrolase [Streptomyces sp. HUAS YS2]